MASDETGSAMTSDGAKATVFIVDDDAGSREYARALAESVHLDVETYSSGAEFLASYDRERRGCLVVDMRMPRMSGLELQNRLAELGSALPIIMVSAYPEVPTVVSAMKTGAVNFLKKPFGPQEFLDQVNHALDINERLRRDAAYRSEAEARLASLTERERQVLDAVIDGKPNKVIAADLGISIKTVDDRRARVMAKMKADSVVDLVRLVLACKR